MVILTLLAIAQCAASLEYIPSKQPTINIYFVTTRTLNTHFLSLLNICIHVTFLHIESSILFSFSFFHLEILEADKKL